MALVQECTQYPLTFVEGCSGRLSFDFRNQCKSRKLNVTVKRKTNP